MLGQNNRALLEELLVVLLRLDERVLEAVGVCEGRCQLSILLE